MKFTNTNTMMDMMMMCMRKYMCMLCYMQKYDSSCIISY